MKPLKKIHIRIMIGAAILMVAFLFWVFALDTTSAVGRFSP